MTPDPAFTLERRFRRILRDNRLIEPGDRVWAAVSGGADSVALFLLLERWQVSGAYDLRLAHVNHRLRGADADADEAFVRQLAQRFRRPIEVLRVDIAAEASRRGQGLELTGREVRREFFSRLAADQPRDGRTVIALAHHQNDLAESLLLHIGRGCGLDGLIGMRLRDGSLIRPLLTVRQAELEQYLRSRKEAWRTDATNSDLTFLRNRLRNQVIPTWDEAIGGSVVDALSRLAQAVEPDCVYLDEVAAQALAECCLSQDTLIERKLRALPEALRRRVMRLFWLQHSRPAYDTERAWSLRLAADLDHWLTGQRQPRSRPLPGGWVFWRHRGELRLIRPVEKIEE